MLWDELCKICSYVKHSVQRINMRWTRKGLLQSHSQIAINPCTKLLRSVTEVSKPPLSLPLSFCLCFFLQSVPWFVENSTIFLFSLGQFFKPFPKYSFWWLWWYVCMCLCVYMTVSVYGKAQICVHVCKCMHMYVVCACVMCVYVCACFFAFSRSYFCTEEASCTNKHYILFPGTTIFFFQFLLFPFWCSWLWVHRALLQLSSHSNTLWKDAQNKLIQGWYISSAAVTSLKYGLLVPWNDCRLFFGLQGNYTPTPSPCRSCQHLTELES